MARGRRPSGPRLVEGLPGSPEAKERARVILETIAGSLTIPEACERLKMSEAHFHRLRERCLETAIESLEPRSPGRPAHPHDDSPGLLALRRRCEELEYENRLGRVREEIAGVLPHIVAEDHKKKRLERPR